MLKPETVLHSHTHIFFDLLHILALENPNVNVYCLLWSVCFWCSYFEINVDNDIKYLSELITIVLITRCRYKYSPNLFFFEHGSIW
jgi:hypothetical protein